MQPLPQIPFADLRGYTPLELLFLYKKRARTLAEAAVTTLGRHSRTAAKFLLPVADRASRLWLEKSHNPYLQEISLMAEAIRIPGAFTLNLGLDGGCTSGAWGGEKGPWLRRVLDRPFPALGETAVVAQLRGKLGDYFNVTWPGFSGVLQAMAPGRFAAAINQAPSRAMFGDWLLGKLKLNWSHALPPSHLLRRVFDTARDYIAAKSMLCMTPIAVPAIFTLTGTRTGEGCVIERTEDSYAVREMAAGRVCATNHFHSRLRESGSSWNVPAEDSPARYSQAEAIAPDSPDLSWFKPPIANALSRLVLAANAATGALKVLGTAGEAPVTEVFELAV